VDPPAGLPAGLTAVGKAADIAVNNQDLINVPFVITLKYDDTSVVNEDNMAVVHYNSVTTKYEPVTVLAHDRVANTFDVESRTFSPFVVVSFDASKIKSSHATGFLPKNNGWSIDNKTAFYFTPQGNCLGMSAYAVWSFENRTEFLNTKFLDSGPWSIPQLLAVRTQLAQSQYWADKKLRRLGDVETAQLMKLYLALFDQPLILLLDGPKVSDRHASVVYGYDTTGFTFYDVNFMNTSQMVTFNGSSWGTYGVYNTFSYVASPSLGRTEDFAALTTEAENGFASSSLMTLTSPSNDQQIPPGNTTLSGSLDAKLIKNDVSVLLYIKGKKHFKEMIPDPDGTFSEPISIDSGGNTLILVAGVNIAEQSNWYPNAAILIRNVTGNSSACLDPEPAITGEARVYSSMANPGGAWFQPGPVLLNFDIGVARASAQGTKENASVRAFSSGIGEPNPAYGVADLFYRETFIVASPGLTGSGIAILSVNASTTATAICPAFPEPNDFGVAEAIVGVSTTPPNTLLLFTAKGICGSGTVDTPPDTGYTANVPFTYGTPIGFGVSLRASASSQFSGGSVGLLGSEARVSYSVTVMNDPNATATFCRATP
jgi:hypothetical protein